MFNQEWWVSFGKIAFMDIEIRTFNTQILLFVPNKFFHSAVKQYYLRWCQKATFFRIKKLQPPTTNASHFHRTPYSQASQTTSTKFHHETTITHEQTKME